MTLAAALRVPGRRAFREVEDWSRLAEGWTFCDVPGVTVDADDRVYLFTRGNCPRAGASSWCEQSKVR